MELVVPTPSTAVDIDFSVDGEDDGKQQEHSSDESDEPSESAPSEHDLAGAGLSLSEMRLHESLLNIFSGNVAADSRTMQNANQQSHRKRRR